MDVVLPIGAGLCVGFLIGLTGMGGGALMTPFLLIVMKLNPVLAVGTDLVFAAVTKIVSGIQHRREKNVSLRAVLWMASGSVPASFLGAQFILTQADNQRLIEEVLPRLLGGILIVVSLILFARVFRWLGPREFVEVKWPAPWTLMIIGAIGGLLVGMTSIGGGTVIMALLLIFFSIPLNFMVGMDVAHGALLAVLSASNYVIAGKVDVELVTLLLIGSLPGTWLGAIIVKRVDMRLVRGLLALLILGAGINLMIA
ncbi:MAG: sulfite exporter TauE/SafE family protein [Anaerolineaceae bacterium]|nr:MAG: sulfite exporter TauE/SafE family protein [Anaerolineaceae bacterium]